MDQAQPLIDAQVNYYKWLSQQEPATKKADRALDEKYIMDMAHDGNILSYEHAQAMAPNASPTTWNIAYEYSKNAQQGKEADYNTARGVTAALNTKADMQRRLAKIEDAEKKPLPGYESLDSYLKAQIKRYDSTLAPYAKTIDRWAQPDPTNPDQFAPAVPLPFHMQKRSTREGFAAPTTPPQESAPGRAVPGASLDVAPAGGAPGATNTAPMVRRPLNMQGTPVDSDEMRPEPLPKMLPYESAPTDNPPARMIQQVGPEDNPPAPPLESVPTRISAAQQPPATATATNAPEGMTRVKDTAGRIWRVPVSAVPGLVQGRGATWIDQPYADISPEMPGRRPRAPLSARQ
jgi:hypothetical protein